MRAAILLRRAVLSASRLSKALTQAVQFDVKERRRLAKKACELSVGSARMTFMRWSVRVRGAIIPLDMPARRSSSCAETEHTTENTTLSRRTFMTGTAASAIAASSAQAQTAVPNEAAPKGPAVWLDMDQKELDDAYDQAKYAPNIRQIVARYRTNSDLTRARLGAPKRLSYGSAPIEGLDLFATKKPNAPINVFLHGGAWRAELAHIMRSRPRCSSMPARITSRSISTTSPRPTAT